VERDIHHSEGVHSYVTAEDLHATATQAITKEIEAMHNTNQDVIIGEITKGILSLKDSIKEVFATKEVMKQLRDEVAEIKQSNKTWMKEQLVKSTRPLTMQR
jgi:hypothetical protein